MESLIIIPNKTHVYLRKGDIPGRACGQIIGPFHSFPLPPSFSQCLNVNLIFTPLHGGLIRSSGYIQLSLLRFHVSRGLSISEYIFRRGTAVTGDSISFTNGPVTRGNFCNILNRTLRRRSASSFSSLFSSFYASSSSSSTFSPLSVPSPFSRTGMGLHCRWTFSRRLRDDDSRNMHRLARLALRITHARACAGAIYAVV